MITHVALQSPYGKIWSLPRPYRHHHLIHLVHEQLSDREMAYAHICRGEQGFLNDKGEFLTRDEAWHEAGRCDQVHRLKGQCTLPLLFSEDLW